MHSGFTYGRLVQRQCILKCASQAARLPVAIREAAVQMLSSEIDKLDKAYGATLDRRFLALDEVAVPNAQRLSLNDLATWVQAYITQGAVPAQAA